MSLMLLLRERGHLLPVLQKNFVHTLTWMAKALLGNDLVNTLKRATIEAVS
jgi:hypothetical protein